MSRSRSCNTPIPIGNGLQCLLKGSSTNRAIVESEAQACNSQSCSVNGGWSQWGSFGACSKNCGGGQRTRSRSCSDPMPASNGLQCLLTGSTNRGIVETDAQACNSQSCTVNGAWSQWGSFSVCSKNCGGGQKTRIRSCNSPMPASKGLQCLLTGSSTNRGIVESDVQACNSQSCSVNGAWGQWGVYGACNKACDGGLKFKTRSCNNPSPGSGGLSCLLSDGTGNRGMLDTSSASCNGQLCAVNGGWGQWSAFNACSKACGGGTLNRRRFCNAPLPVGTGSQCLLSDGSNNRGTLDSQSQPCNSQACSVSSCATGNTCHQFAVCQDSAGGGHICQCKSGYSGNGQQCADVNECLTAGICTHSQCINTFGSFQCYCLAGYTKFNNTMCVSKAPTCQANSCPKANEQCSVSGNAIKCLCNSGFQRASNGACELIKQTCQTLKCSGNHYCQENSQTGAICVCKSGFQGTQTQCSDFNECALHWTCAHAACLNMYGSYICICNPGWTKFNSTYCLDIDECKTLTNNKCHQFANCVNTPSSYDCVCKPGYKGNGTYCELEAQWSQ